MRSEKAYAALRAISLATEEALCIHGQDDIMAAWVACLSAAARAISASGKLKCKENPDAQT